MPHNLSGIDWPVRTERLLIRRATPADADATWTYRRLEQVSRWLTGAATDRADYARTFSDPDRLACTLIVQREDPEGPTVIGDLKLAVENAWAQTEIAAQAVGVQAEIGWVLDPAQHGRGYGTEAVTALLEMAFDRLRLRRVVAYCFAANEPSWRLMERVGMRREGYSVADALHRSGRWLDGMVYALLADEWRALRRSPTPPGALRDQVADPKDAPRARTARSASG